MANRDKISDLMKRAAPYLTRMSDDVASDTVAKEIDALILALESHKASADHDTRYPKKEVSITAGWGLTGGGDLSQDRALSIDESLNYVWLGFHTFSGGMIVEGPFALASEQLTINSDGSDEDVELKLHRETGGDFSIFWNGDIAWTTNAFRPSDLLINRISDTEPSNPKAGMVWIDPNG